MSMPFPTCSAVRLGGTARRYGSEVSFEPSYSVWNASLAYRTSDDRLSVSAYVKNFTNEQYRLYNLDLGLLGFIEQVFAPPRTYGGLVTYRW
jgi:iron complex outermembrane receptor protein